MSILSVNCSHLCVIYVKICEKISSGGLEVTFSIDGIKKVSRACGKSPLRTGVSLLLDARKDIGREPGVFSVDGDLWLDYRRKMTSSLIRSDFTEATKMVSAAKNDFLVRTKHICDKEGKVTLEYELDKYTTQVLGLLLYSKDFGCFDETGQSDGVKCTDNVRLMFQALHKMLYYPARFAKTFCRKNLECSSDCPFFYIQYNTEMGRPSCGGGYGTSRGNHVYVTPYDPQQCYDG